MRLVLGIGATVKKVSVLLASVMRELMVNFMPTGFGNEPGSGRGILWPLLLLLEPWSCPWC